MILEEMAMQTYLGIKNYLSNEEVKKNTFANFSNYQFRNNLTYGHKGKEVLALQDYLRDRDFYPFKNNLNNCPLNGNFKDCTKFALKNFQQEKGLNITGSLDIATLNFINSNDV
jgi:peptidoglycan hydrolase-like protein with peptidoglycan-binding domain